MVVTVNVMGQKLLFVSVSVLRILLMANRIIFEPCELFTLCMNQEVLGESVMENCCMHVWWLPAALQLLFIFPAHDIGVY